MGHLTRYYNALRRRYYRGLNGYGALLTLLTFLTALGTTAVGAQSTRSGSNQWLAYAVAALGGLHTLLVLVETRWSSHPLIESMRASTVPPQYMLVLVCT